MLRNIHITFIFSLIISCSPKNKPNDVLTTSHHVDRDFIEIDTVKSNNYYSETWWLDIEPAKGVVILIHNAKSNAMFWTEAQRLYKNGYSVVLSTFPQFTDSTLSVAEKTIQQKIWLEALYAKARNHFGNSHMQLYGFELGANLIIQTYPTLYPQPEQLVLHDVSSDLFTFYYLANNRNQEGFWKYWINTQLNDSFLSTEHALQSINSPVLFITGTENNQVFNAQTSQLYEAFTGDKQLAQFNNSTHGSIAYSEADAWEYFVINFLNSGRESEGI